MLYLYQENNEDDNVVFISGKQWGWLCCIYIWKTMRMIMLYLYLENNEDDYIVFISGKQWGWLCCIYIWKSVRFSTIYLFLSLCMHIYAVHFIEKPKLIIILKQKKRDNFISFEWGVTWKYIYKPLWTYFSLDYIKLIWFLFS